LGIFTIRNLADLRAGSRSTSPVVDLDGGDGERGGRVRDWVTLVSAGGDAGELNGGSVGDSVEGVRKKRISPGGSRWSYKRKEEKARWVVGSRANRCRRWPYLDTLTWFELELGAA
jgi:hypothetical protein